MEGVSAWTGKDRRVNARANHQQEMARWYGALRGMHSLSVSILRHWRKTGMPSAGVDDFYSV